jgi:flagellar hook-associated protein 1 FlgK
MSIFSSYYTAISGLTAQQVNLSTTSHNLANATTEGFSRQRVDLSASDPHTIQGIGTIGMGVDIDGIYRIRESYLDRQVRTEYGNLEKYTAKQEVLEQVELILDETQDVGISSYMSDFYDALQSLSNSPESSTTRTSLVQTALTLTDDLNHKAQQLADVEDFVSSNVNGETFNINALVDEIESVNNQIYRSTLQGIYPNDLLDAQDLALSELSKLTDINYSYDSDGRISLSVEQGGIEYALISDDVNVENEISTIQSIDTTANTITIFQGGDSTSTAITISVADASIYSPGDTLLHLTDTARSNLSGTTPAPTLTEGDITIYSPERGSLSGYQETLEDIGSYTDQLDDLARTMAGVINIIHNDNHAAATDPDAVADVNFFTDDAGGTDITALNITVNSAIQDDLTLINAGETAVSAVGDGSRALAMAQSFYGEYSFEDSYDPATGYDATTMSVADVSGGTTYSEYFTDTVTTIGIDANYANNVAASQETMVLQLEQRIESVSGVSTDEEAANLIVYQNAYQANARVMNTLTTMLDALISMAQ